MPHTPFWKTKKPDSFTAEEWESVCMHCGKCCLIRLQDEAGADVYETDVICRYHDCQTHLCRCYAERCRLVPECLRLTPQNIGALSWIPDTCAYAFLAQTGDLPPWHPLVSGKPLPAEFKVSPHVVSELLVPLDELEDHIVEDDDNV